jgi:chromosome segregation ATPase
MSGGGPSILNILLLYVSLLGLGALGGYAAFYASFSERCSALLRETEGLHNASKQVYVDKYEAAMEGQRQCMSDSTVKGELQKLQGTLESQSNLADRHQALLDKQEQTLAKLSALQELSQENGNTIHELREKLSQMRMELTTEKQRVEMVTRERDTLESELQGRLGETQGMLELREQKVQELLSKAEEYDYWMPLISEEVALMKNYFLQRDHARCKLQ